MLTAEQNELVTRAGPGSPGGDVLRRYWQPAALVEELADRRPVKAVRLLGEDLVLYGTENGGYGLVGRQCPHRGADLCYGRLEDGGLRCAFHGWLFDEQGQCLEQPAEPPGSNFHRKIRHTAYPCVARNGIVFAYMGPGKPPPLPEFDCFAAPDGHTFAFKGYIDCNWLQALEVGIDPSHASFLHRFFEDESTEKGYGQQFRARTADASVPVTKVLREHFCPQIDVQKTDYGLRIFALRALGNECMHVRVTNLMFPTAIVIPMSDDMVITQWHVPIDDESCWWYAIFSSFKEPVNKDLMRRQRIDAVTGDYRPVRNKSNDYGYDPDEQRTSTYTGMGMDINVHDTWAVESQGRIQDRTREHLGAADKAIIANRRLLMAAIDGVRAGASPEIAPSPAVAGLTGPVAIDTIVEGDGWQQGWKDHELARRAAAAWPAAS